MGNMKVSKIFGVMLLTVMLAACIGDTVASAKAIVWLDKNGNGIFDGGETPMTRVLIRTSGLGTDQFTDKNGEAHFGNFCADDCWKGDSLTAETPNGFLPTTPTQVYLTGYSGTYQFGFKPNPSKPTATSYSPHLSCQNYNGIDASRANTAPDGTLWVSTLDGIANYDPAKDAFVSQKGKSVYDGDFSFGLNNEIWLTTPGEAARYQNSEWITYQQDSLLGDSTINFAETSDGAIWFATADGLIGFNKLTNQWKYYTGTFDVPYIIGKKVRLMTDGAIWFAAINYSEKNTPSLPASNAKIQWKIYDPHIFDKAEVIETPLDHWIEGSQIGPDSTIWLATTNGLAKFTPSNKDWKIYPWPSSDTIEVSSSSAHEAIRADGSIWIGTESLNRPLLLKYTPDAENGHWDFYDDRDGVPAIYDMAITPDNRIWFIEDDHQITACSVKQ